MEGGTAGVGCAESASRTYFQFHWYLSFVACCCRGAWNPPRGRTINTYFCIFFFINSLMILACAANPPAVLNWRISAPSFDLKLCGAGQ